MVVVSENRSDGNLVNGPDFWLFFRISADIHVPAYTSLRRGIFLVFLDPCMGLFLAKNPNKFLAINIFFLVNETKSGHPNKRLFH